MMVFQKHIIYVCFQMVFQINLHNADFATQDYFLLEMDAKNENVIKLSKAI